LLGRLSAVSEDHVGTDLEKRYGSAAERIRELLRDHDQTVYFGYDGNDNKTSARRLKKLLRACGTRNDTAHCISNAKVQQGASAANKAAAAAQRFDDEAALS
jgi:glyoxylase-like metal-dependent hydrolase (beta-lactamase superfamily II)